MELGVEGSDQAVQRLRDFEDAGNALMGLLRRLDQMVRDLFDQLANLPPVQIPFVGQAPVGQPIQQGQGQAVDVSRAVSEAVNRALERIPEAQGVSNDMREFLRRLLDSVGTLRDTLRSTEEGGAMTRFARPIDLGRRRVFDDIVELTRRFDDFAEAQEQIPGDIIESIRGMQRATEAINETRESISGLSEGAQQAWEDLQRVQEDISTEVAPRIQEEPPIDPFIPRQEAILQPTLPEVLERIVEPEPSDVPTETIDVDARFRAIMEATGLDREMLESVINDLNETIETVAARRREGDVVIDVVPPGTPALVGFERGETMEPTPGTPEMTEGEITRRFALLGLATGMTRSQIREIIDEIDESLEGLDVTVQRIGASVDLLEGEGVPEILASLGLVEPGEPAISGATAEELQRIRLAQAMDEQSVNRALETYSQVGEQGERLSPAQVVARLVERYTTGIDSLQERSAIFGEEQGNIERQRELRRIGSMREQIRSRLEREETIRERGFAIPAVERLRERVEGARERVQGFGQRLRERAIRAISRTGIIQPAEEFLDEQERARRARAEGVVEHRIGEETLGRGGITFIINNPQIRSQEDIDAIKEQLARAMRLI